MVITGYPDGIDGQLTTTSGTSSGYYIDYSPPAHDMFSWVYPYWGYEREVELKTCMGKAHVFECKHESTCKCGKVTRVMSKARKK